MCQEKKEEEDTPALETASIPRFLSSRKLHKKSKGRLMTATRNNESYTRIKRITKKKKKKEERKK